MNSPRFEYVRPLACLGAAVALLVGCIGTVQASTISLPSAVVPGSAAAGGPSFMTTTAWQPGDVLEALISGTVNFDSTRPDFYSADWNAAGIVVNTYNPNLTVGQTLPAYINQGYLRLALGNPTLGFFPLLEANAADGLGSAAPPTTLTLSRTVSDIFGAGLPAGTMLEYRVYDSPTTDNTGAFTVAALAVDEPSMASLLPLGALVMLVVSRRKSKGDAA